MITAALVALVAPGLALGRWRSRVRSGIRGEWQATRQQDWTTAELDALGASDPAV